MSKSNAWETALQAYVFNATAISWSANGSHYISLHTADPGEAGDQTTSEIAYTTYARVAVVRTSGGFTCSTNSVTNAAAVTFPACTAGSGTATYFGVGTASSGAGILLYSGALTSSLAISAGITPSFAIGALTITED